MSILQILTEFVQNVRVLVRDSVYWFTYKLV